MKKITNQFHGPKGANPNFNEEKVNPYKLPDLFHSISGEVISTFEEWDLERRPEILKLYEEYIFGSSPVSASVSFKKSGPKKVNIKKGICAQLYNIFLNQSNALLTQFVVFSPLNTKDDLLPVD